LCHYDCATICSFVARTRFWLILKKCVIVVSFSDSIESSCEFDSISISLIVGFRTSRFRFLWSLREESIHYCMVMLTEMMGTLFTAPCTNMCNNKLINCNEKVSHNFWYRIDLRKERMKMIVDLKGVYLTFSFVFTFFLKDWTISRFIKVVRSRKVICNSSADIYCSVLK
jgi:hypothetical protein